MSDSAANGDAQKASRPSSIMQAKGESEATAEELAQAPETFNLSEAEELNAANDKDNSEGGKIKALLNVLRRMIGVKDLAAIRLSLPANLLEPVPNLEYWNYMDRGDLFTIVGDLDDPLDRMLATLRFAFCKELKFVHGKICKPYNSILGEHFLCHWDVLAPELSDKNTIVPRMSLLVDTPTPMPLASSTASSGSSIRSAKRFGRGDRRGAASKDVSVDETADSGAGAATGTTKSSNTVSPMTSNDAGGKTRRGLSRFLSAARTPKSSANSINSSDSTSTSGKTATSTNKPQEEQSAVEEEQDAAAVPDDDGTASPAGSFKTSKSENEPRRVCFLTEQVSHHPPISSFVVECKEAGVELRGVDQLSAKFTGTNVKIFPGEQNKGIFLSLTDQARCGAEGEEYQITHPTASVNGMLRGSLWVSIQNTTYVTCRGGKRSGDNKGRRLRAITEYKDESWVMKAKYALEGVVYEYDYEEGSDAAAEEYTSVRDVPSDRVVLTYEGTWKGQVTYKLKGEKEARLLLDMNELDTIKSLAVRPLASQEEMESRKIWNDVTEAIIGKEFGQATKHKQTIEQLQRDKAAERKRKGEAYTPRFFDPDITDGRPKLTEEGRKALEGELNLAGYDGNTKE